MENLKANYIDSSYEILTELGDKEPCKTFLAKQKTTGTIVVKKQIPQSLFPIYYKLQSLSHPNVVKILELYTLGQDCFSIEEYISGESIASILEQKLVFTEQQTANYISQLCDALHFLHMQGVIHRDVNPNNVIISTDQVIKLIDFDIARSKKPAQTQDTTILGTVGYAAPEQFGFGQTDERSDIYAVGVLMNVMLTRQFPNVALPSNSQLRQLIEHCTCMDPSSRYHSIRQVQEQLCHTSRINTANTTLSKPNASTVTGLSRFIPGFRTNTPWKKAIGIVGYIILALLTAATIAGKYEPHIKPLHIVGFLVFILYLPWAIIVNLGHYDRYLSLFQGVSRWQAVLLKASLLFLCFVCCMIVFLF